MIEIVAASLSHVEHLVATLRPDDRRELEAFGIEPSLGLRLCIEQSAEAFTALEAGAPIACWGVVAPSIIGSAVAWPWLLTAHGVEHHKVRFFKENRRWLAAVLTRYPRLEVLVDAKYTRALTWLRRLGFTVHDGALFCRAHIEASTWV